MAKHKKAHPRFRPPRAGQNSRYELKIDGILIELPEIVFRLIQDLSYEADEYLEVLQVYANPENWISNKESSDFPCCIWRRNERGYEIAQKAIGHIQELRTPDDK